MESNNTFHLKATHWKDPQILAGELRHVEMLEGPIDPFWLKKTIHGGTPYILENNQRPCGYCVLFEKTLTELFLFPDYRPLVGSVISHLISNSYINSALASSRNPYLLNPCLDVQKGVGSVAFLFTDQHPELQPKQALPLQPAEEGDREWLQETDCNRDFQQDLASRNGFVFEKKGYGFFTPSLLQPEYIDIGVWIDPKHRNQGLGAELILHLKQMCYARGKTPTCGCDLYNRASKRMLEKCGFQATDRMLQISLDSPH